MTPVLQASFSPLFATAPAFPMTDCSPYGPDHSLLHAALVLLVGLGVVAAGFYLLTTIDEPFSDQSQIPVAETPTQAPPPSSAPRSAPAGRGLLAPGGESAPVGGGVPAWAGADDPSAPSGQFAPGPQGSYDVNPDLGHAQLGSPSDASVGGPGGGAAIADAGPSGEDVPTGEASGAGPPPSTPDLNEEASGRWAAGGNAPQWRSEARALASRSRALSNELGQIDRAGNRESHSRSEGPPGEATTASGSGASASSGPGTPGDPNQVPLGGAEWLAAAGAAYALNRLRKEGGADDETEDEA